MPSSDKSCLVIMYYWIEFANILLKTYIFVHDEYWGIVLFLCDIFIWPWYQSNNWLQKISEKYFLLLSFLKGFVQDCYFFFVKYLIEFTVKPSGTTYFFMESLKLQIDIGLIQILYSCVSLIICWSKSFQCFVHFI